jgi:hypothetical protein
VQRSYCRISAVAAKRGLAPKLPPFGSFVACTRFALNQRRPTQLARKQESDKENGSASGVRPQLLPLIGSRCKAGTGSETPAFWEFRCLYPVCPAADRNVQNQRRPTLARKQESDVPRVLQIFDNGEGLSRAAPRASSDMVVFRLRVPICLWRVPLPECRQSGHNREKLTCTPRLGPAILHLDLDPFRWLRRQLTERSTRTGRAPDMSGWMGRR